MLKNIGQFRFRSLQWRQVQVGQIPEICIQQAMADLHVLAQRIVESGIDKGTSDHSRYFERQLLLRWQPIDTGEHNALDSVGQRLGGLVQVAADNTARPVLLGLHCDEAIIAQGIHQFFREEGIAASSRAYQLSHSRWQLANG